MKKYPLIIEPTIAESLWGGTGLNEYYKHEGKASEAYVLSTQEDKPSIICNGSLSGKSLKKIFEDYPYWVKDNEPDTCPIIIKLAHTAQFPSIQVHPTDIYAMSHMHSLGKVEAWYIVEAEEGAGVYVGFNKDTTEEEVLQRLKDKTLLEIMNFEPVKKGDIVEIDAGNIHTLTPGIKLIAIQENCNITYRLYDYDRNDPNRPLLIKEGLSVTNFKKTNKVVAKLPMIFENDDVILKKDFAPYFKLYDVKTKGTLIYNENSMVWMMTLDGELELEYVRMGKLVSTVVPRMYSCVIPRDFRVKVKNSGRFIKVEI